MVAMSSRYQVIAHTRALHLTVRAEFDDEPVAANWAQRLFKAKERGASVTIGNVRLVGTEITQVEYGPVGGPTKILGQHPAVAEANALALAKAIAEAAQAPEPAATPEPVAP
jgi:hypothetical protein